MLNTLPVENILKQTLKKGGDYSELFLEQSRRTSILCDNKKLENVSVLTDLGAGLRLLSNHKTSYGFTNDLSSSELINLADRVGMAGSDNKHHGDLNLTRAHPHTLPTIALPPGTVPTQKKIDLVKQAEALAYSLSPEIVQVQIRYSDFERNVRIANSDGHDVLSPATLMVMTVNVTATDGKEFFKGYQAIGGYGGLELLSQEEIDQAVKQAVKRALLNKTARKADGGIMPVVISSDAGGTMVHEAVGHGLEADLACEGMSVYGGQLGKTVASSLVSIVDDPTLPQKRGFYLYDDEGAVATPTLLIKNGQLQNYMHNRLTAMKNNTTTNGHGRRQSYAHRPIVRMSNTYMLPGNDNPSEIISSVSSGLFVKMMGGGEVNTVSGDFVFEVTEGYRIENGKIGEPVRGATLTGNGPEVLKMIDKVGNDLGFAMGTCGKDGQGAPVTDAMPTVRIPQMVVGGMTAN